MTNKVKNSGRSRRQKSDARQRRENNRTNQVEKDCHAFMMITSRYGADRRPSNAKSVQQALVGFEGAMYNSKVQSIEINGHRTIKTQNGDEHQQIIPFVTFHRSGPQEFADPKSQQPWWDTLS